jgi:hypothetical protein
MLCSSAVPIMSIDQGLHHDATLAHPSTSSHHHHSNNSSRTSSPSSTPTVRSVEASTSALPTRPRHHARSFSTESRFSPQQSTVHAPAQGISSASNHTATSTSPPTSTTAASTAEISASPSIVIDPSSPPLSLPTRAKKLPSPPMSITEASNGRSTSPQKGSPSKRVGTLEETQEQERLAALKEQQANRRPKMMRLTPAYSSTPVKLPSPLGKVMGKKGPAFLIKSNSQDSDPRLVSFPAKDSLDQENEPGAGLQIDLGCIPSPSLQDLNGPVSTSQLDGLVRDRNGNPIKPSLKSPRSSVSHFLPGRTSRSDSTPTIPTSLLSKSVPSTPTVAKAVHFDSKLEHIKVFKFKQRPTAVSRDGSPEQTETETEEEKDQFPYIWRKNSNSNLRGDSPMPVQTQSNHQSAAPMPEMEEQLVLRLPNFPSSTRVSVDREIFLERIFLAEDLRSVKGTVQVQNMSFEKWVAIRYTLDHWATIGEVSAEYSETIKGGQVDRFTFSIKLNELLNWPRGSAAHETKSMFMCLRYTVNSTEYWDNNDGLNYQLDFRKRQVPSTPLSTPTAAGPTSTTTIAQPRATVPDSVALGAPGRSKVFDLARKGVVGGKGVFAMEDLKRELDKLRSDEESEEQTIASRTLVSELAKKRVSPPVSPGARSNSPSIWTARYDFGQSLRNPRSGSRSTGSGRAAALDYFSAKPMARTGSNSLNSSGENGIQVVVPPPSNSLSTSSLVDRFEQMSQVARNSPDFSHKFGMISPGLAGGPVEHLPRNSESANPSAEVSPAPTPQQDDADQSPLTTPNRFYSYPPNRRNGNMTPTPTSSGRISPAFFTPSEGSESFSRSTSQELQIPSAITPMARLEKEGEPNMIGAYYSPSVSSSSISDYGSPNRSPNPFSPADSVTSTESDVMVALLSTPEERQATKQKAASAVPSHARREYTSTKSLDSISRGGLASIAPAMAAQVEADRLRPASMSDYQELVNKFCWNSDLVPSGGSTIPDMPMHGGLGGSTTLQVDGQSLANLSPTKIKSPAPSSGGSTPTLT